MSIAELGALGEFVSSIAVVVSIVYLSIQIRSNTRTTRASATFDGLHSWAQFNEQASFQPDDWHELILKALASATNEDDFTDPEWSRITMGFRAIMQKLEGQYYLYKYGLMEPDIWEKRSRVARGMIESPLMWQWWKHEQPHETFSDEFVKAVEDAPVEVPGTSVNRKPSTID
jgi:hypothetical protein